MDKNKVNVKKQKKLPPTIERYELKFHISPELIKPISAFISIYCSPDKYSLMGENDFYRVNNLYIDSPGFEFYKMRKAGVNNRFNMRIRAYGDKGELPYFLEIKQKVNGVVRKYRAPINEQGWYKSYTEPGCRQSNKAKSRSTEKNKRLFERLIYTYNAQPKVATQYARNAWVSDVDEYARVTFDIEMKFRQESEYRLSAFDEGMVHCDASVIYDPGCSVILELKCNTLQVPLWMIDLIKTFDLQRRSFSKYITAIDEMMGFHHISSDQRVGVLY